MNLNLRLLLGCMEVPNDKPGDSFLFKAFENYG